MSEVSAIAISFAKPGYEEKLADALEGLLASRRRRRASVRCSPRYARAALLRLYRTMGKPGNFQRALHIAACQGLPDENRRLGREQQDSCAEEREITS